MISCPGLLFSLAEYNNGSEGASIAQGVLFVMPGLDPAIHVLLVPPDLKKSWMPGSSPGMTGVVCRTTLCKPYQWIREPYARL
jgi:hypothetical protein